MSDDPDLSQKAGSGGVRGFLTDFLMGLVRDAVKLVIAFAIGTGAGAIVCWYYSIPLVLSLLGGILVLAVVLVFLSDGLFS